MQNSVYYSFLNCNIIICLNGQIIFNCGEAEPLVCQQPHLSVGHPVVQRHRRHVVEGDGQVVGHLLLHAHHTLHQLNNVYSYLDKLLKAT